MNFYFLNMCFYWFFNMFFDMFLHIRIWIQPVLNAWNYQFDAVVKDAVLIALRKHFFFAFIWTSQWNAHIKKTSKWIHVRTFLLNFQGKCVEAMYKLVPTKFKEKCTGGQKKGWLRRKDILAIALKCQKIWKKGKSWRPVHVYCIVNCYLAAFPLCIWLQTRHSGPDKMLLCSRYQRRIIWRPNETEIIFAVQEKNALQTHEMSMKNVAVNNRKMKERTILDWVDRVHCTLQYAHHSVVSRNLFVVFVPIILCISPLSWHLLCKTDAKSTCRHKQSGLDLISDEHLYWTHQANPPYKEEKKVFLSSDIFFET